MWTIYKFALAVMTFSLITNAVFLSIGAMFTGSPTIHYTPHAVTTTSCSGSSCSKSTQTIWTPDAMQTDFADSTGLQLNTKSGTSMWDVMSNSLFIGDLLSEIFFVPSDSNPSENALKPVFDAINTIVLGIYGVCFAAWVLNRQINKGAV